MYNTLTPTTVDSRIDFLENEPLVAKYQLDYVGCPKTHHLTKDEITGKWKYGYN